MGAQASGSRAGGPAGAWGRGPDARPLVAGRNVASGACRGDERACGDVEASVASLELRQTRLDRGADLLDLARRALEHRVVEHAREVERRLPELVEVAVHAMQVQRLDTHVGEPGLVEQL